MAETLESIQARTNERFPTQGFIIKDFRGMNEAVEFICPTHGKQHVSKASNFIRSVYGCPECAKIASVEKLKVAREFAAPQALQFLKAVKGLDPTLSDGDFGKLVRAKLQELNHN